MQTPSTPGEPVAQRKLDDGWQMQDGAPLQPEAIPTEEHPMCGVPIPIQPGQSGPPIEEPNEAPAHEPYLPPTGEPNLPQRDPDPDVRPEPEDPNHKPEPRHDPPIPSEPPQPEEPHDPQPIDPPTDVPYF
ncbi:MAG TPA: hypothetical protein VLC08_12660 [Chitinolyticbacter sp.]|nr:hypothetical protein [Chitinolyticbacter sp.]